MAAVRDSPSSAPTGLRAVLPVLLRNAIGPYLVYAVLHAAGWSNLAALVAGAAASAVLVCWDALRERRFNALSGVILLALLLAIAVTLVTGNAWIALARDSAVTAGLGIAFLVSLAAHLPAMYHLFTSVSRGSPAAGSTVERLTASGALAVVTAVWGVGLLLDAALRLWLAMTLPVSTAAPAITVLTICTVAVLLGWMRWYLRRRMT